MSIIAGFSRNYTNTVIQIVEKCDFFTKIEDIANQSLKISELRYQMVTSIHH